MSPHRIAPHGFFVTGTDTAVGKTLVACVLLRWFVARGYTAVGMKPVSAGGERTPEGWRNDDVEALRAAGNVAAPAQSVNPYCFAPPIAPHIAAQLEGITIAPQEIDDAYRALRQRADVVIVEGVGGFLVPLAPGFDTAQLACRLQLPVILVVGLRLGCLNHALLTAEAIRARGLALCGWVANHIDAGMLHVERNIDALAERLAAPCLARIPHGAADAAAAARLLHPGPLFACSDIVLKPPD